MIYSSTLEALQALRGGLCARVDAAVGARHKRLLAQLQALDEATAPLVRKAERAAKTDEYSRVAKRVERARIKAQCDAEIEEAKARQSVGKLFSLPRRT